MGDRPWAVARRGIKLLLNDKNEEAESLFLSSPPAIQITAGLCLVTFMNALMSFDEDKVNEAIAEIKKIEEQCVNQIGWMQSFKNRLFYNQAHAGNKNLEQMLEEKIVLADALVCQSFLTFLHNDFASYMKGGWSLRRAWKVYQHTYDLLVSIYRHKFGSVSMPGWSNNVSEHLQRPRSSGNHASGGEDLSDNSPTLEYDLDDLDLPKNGRFYSCASKTFSDFTATGTKGDPEEASSSVPLKSRPDTLKPRLSISSSAPEETSAMKKSISLFASLSSFRSAIIESASSLINLSTSSVKEPYQDWDSIDGETVMRLMSAVSFGYGFFRLCVSLAPSGILKWVNMFGFEGDQTIAIKSLQYSRKGTDMRAPLASLALLWYHTVVNQFFNVDGAVAESGIEEANKILDDEKEFADSALFLFFKGRVERLKPNINAAIEAYQTSINRATISEMKLLSLHEVGWCHLLTLNFKEAYKCFNQLKQQSKWSKSFYAYLSTICMGAIGKFENIPRGKAEIKYYLEKSANKESQIEKYIQRRMEKLPEENDLNEEWVKDKVYWSLYCYEMLYLWNTFTSCRTSDLLKIIDACSPEDNDNNDLLKNEPMLGIGWLVIGAAFVALANMKHPEDDNHKILQNSAGLLKSAADAFRMCLHLRSKCSDDVHISAFAQYELALLLLRKETTRPDGKIMLSKLLSQYTDYDFEHRLNLKVSATLRSVEKYESRRK